jgi:hypothetical protein
MIVGKGCNNSCIAELSTSWYILFQQIIFLSYYFYEFADFFSPRNVQHLVSREIRERSFNLSKTWFGNMVGNGPNRNQVYSISNTTTENFRTAQSVSTHWCLQSVLSTQTPELKVILNQQVEAQTTHFTVETERLSAEMINI